MWYVLLCVVSLGWAQTPLDKDDHLSWLLFQDLPNSSGFVVRRITPKSVFLAPTVCPNGTQLDKNNRCTKVVKVNTVAQEEFQEGLFLEALNALNLSDYLPQPPNKPSTGPITFEIPIAPDDPTTTTTSTEATTTHTTTTELPTKPTTTNIPLVSSTTEESTTTFPTTSTTQVDETTTDDILSSSTTEPGTTEMSTFPTTTEDSSSTTTDSESTTDLESSTTELSTSPSPTPSTETIDIKLGVKKLKCGVGIQVIQSSDAQFTPLDCVEEAPDPTTYPPPPPPPPPIPIRFPVRTHTIRFPQERHRPSSFETNHAYPPPYKKQSFYFFPSFWPSNWSRNRN